MDIFRSTYDESNYGYGLTHKSDEVREATSSSNLGATTSHSDEEVILASTRPKKRAGRRVFKETRHPVYRGVRKRNKNKWVCEMRVPNNKSRIWLGTYPTPEMAARAHDVAALALRGKSACLNFADSAWRLTLPPSTDAEDIRKAAVEAAEAFSAEDINNHQQQSVKGSTSTSDHYECMVMEDGNKDKALQQEEVLITGDVPELSEFQELHDLLLSIADEPLRSPPPPFPRDSRDWNDVDILDADVSLWSFSF